MLQADAVLVDVEFAGSCEHPQRYRFAGIKHLQSGLEMDSFHECGGLSEGFGKVLREDAAVRGISLPRHEIRPAEGDLGSRKFVRIFVGLEGG